MKASDLVEIVAYLDPVKDHVRIMGILVDYPKAIAYIDEPSEAMQYLVIEKSLEFVRYIKNMSIDIQYHVIEQKPVSLLDIKNPSDEVTIRALCLSGSMLHHIDNPTYKMQMAAVLNYGAMIQYCPDADDEMKAMAIRSHGCNIKYIDNPSEELQLLAVTDRGFFGEYAIEHIDNPSEYIKLMAVETWPRAILHIKNPSYELIFKALIREPSLYPEFANLPDGLDRVVFAQNKGMIKYMPNPTCEEQMAAVRASLSYFDYLNNPCNDVIAYVKSFNR